MKNDFLEKELELGRFVEDDLIQLSDSDEQYGGVTPTILWAGGAVGGFISSNTCPTTACTRRC